MKRFLSSVAAVFLFAAVLLYLPGQAEAVPAFARQTGMACNSCHFQHFPSLNAFGRAFKAGGYTMVGGQSLVEGDLLSIPTTLNMSLVTKLRYQKRSGYDDNELNKGELQFPDEAAFLVGGRAGEHVGFLLEAQLANGGAAAFASYKMPIVFDVANVKVSAIPFKTDGLGASYGLELMNTGAVRHQRPLEHRGDFSAQQYVDTSGAATGLALVAVDNLWHVNYSAWAPVDGTNASSPYLNYIRAAVTPTVSGWDVAAGVQLWNGTTKQVDSALAPASTTVRTSADAYALDAQLQGNAGNYPLGVYFSYASAKKSEAGKVPNMFNASVNKAKSAWALAGELGVIPNRVTVALAYRSGKDGDGNDGPDANGDGFLDGDGKDSQTATTVGVNYNATQNVQVQVNHSRYGGDEKPSANAGTAGEGDSLTTIMLFSAF
ncbi:MAG: OprO/OprP family phosphate-selective porin [Deltaproteobacteria bacterium]|nr:OprO/OprP family phosphate-selective porin [Deltaproteobacteria bacterium]